MKLLIAILDAWNFLTYRPAEPREVISAIIKEGKVDREYDPKEYEAAK
jgi:hypothetical protein